MEYYINISEKREVLMLSEQPQIGSKFIFDGVVYVVKDFVTTIARQSDTTTLCSVNTEIIVEPTMML